MDVVFVDFGVVWLLYWLVCDVLCGGVLWELLLV